MMSIQERHLRTAMREQERLYELKSMRLFRMKELEPFLQEAQEGTVYGALHPVLLSRCGG